MKAMLRFDLPEEQESFEMAVDGAAAHFVIQDLFNMIRQKYKYENKTSIKLEELREYLADSCKEYQLRRA